MNDRSPLDVLIDDARGELADVATPMPRGLADVFARAAALDPSLELCADDAARLDALPDDAVDRVAAIGSLDTLIASARAQLGAIADEARPGPVPRRDHRRAWIASVVAVAAALLIVALSTWSLRDSLRETPRAAEYSGANQTAREDASERAVEIEPPKPKPRVTPSIPEPLPEPAVPPAPLEVGKPRPTPQAIEARLEQLDRDARDAWKRGDLAAAESRFEAVVKSGGRRAIADLAFGDLFELARQRKDAAGESALWRRYVRRFPGGRYVDEARAGLCRRESGDAARRCWSAYLADRPRGTYRDQAARAIGESAP